MMYIYIINSDYRHIIYLISLSCVKSGCSHRSLRNEMKPRVAHFSLAPLSTMYLEGSYTTVGMVKNGYAVTMGHTWIIWGPAFCNLGGEETVIGITLGVVKWFMTQTGHGLASAVCTCRSALTTALQLGCSNFRKEELSGANPDNPTESIALAILGSPTHWSERSW